MAVLLSETELFRGIAPEKIEALSRCLQMREGEFAPGERIAFYDGRTEHIGLVLEGSVLLTRAEYDGRNTVLEYLGEGSVFGEALALGARGGEVGVYAEERAKVLFLDFDHLVKRCANACQHHSLLVEKMLRLTARKIGALSSRVEVLASRSIREKLLRYFRQLALEAGSNAFELPFSMSCLADYLCTDRSAMTRELAVMKREGILTVDRRKVVQKQKKHPE